jgi:hypothetical protein
VGESPHGAPQNDEIRQGKFLEERRLPRPRRSLAALLAGNGDLLRSSERKARDLVAAATCRAPVDKIGVIAIDPGG